MAKKSPTARTLDRLRQQGWTPAVVEKWIPHTQQRKDLFGVIDVLAVKPGLTLGVQACSDSGGKAGIPAHLEKCLAEPRLVQWLLAGNLFEVWGWCKRKKGWRLRVCPVVLSGDGPKALSVREV